LPGKFQIHWICELLQRDRATHRVVTRNIVSRCTLHNCTKNILKGLQSVNDLQNKAYSKAVTKTISSSAQNLPLSQILLTKGPLSFSRTDTTDSGCSPFFFSICGFVLVPCGRLRWFLLAFDCTLILLLLTYLHLVAAILMIFLITKLSKFMQLKQY